MVRPITGETPWEVATPLGFRVRVTRACWEVIVTMKHPVMAGRETDVQAALASPDEIRQSKSDAEVYLFYRRERGGGFAPSQGVSTVMDSSLQHIRRTS